MLTRWFPGLTALCVLAAATPLRAADDKQSDPALVVRVRSLNALIDTGKYLASLAGQEERAKQAERMIKNRIGDKGLEGIDAKKPFGLYAHELKIFHFPVLMVPVANQKALLNLLKRLDFEPKEQDGLYTISRDEFQVEVYFRFANGYAYVTALDSGDLDPNKLLDPAIIKLDSPSALAAGSLNIDRLPATIKQLAIHNLEMQFKRIQRQKPRRESEAETNLRVETLKEMAATLAAVIKEGGEARLQLEVDRKTQELGAQLSLTGKSGSKLARDIARLGDTTSLFSTLAGKDAAFTGSVHFTLPEGIRQALGPVIDDAASKLRDKERDETKRELAEKFLKAVAPSLKAGELDVLVTLRGPSKNKHYTGIAAVKVKDGTELEKTIRDIIDRVAPETEKAKIKFDADKVGDVAIHRVTVKDNLDAGARKTFGDADLYVAFRKDAAIAVLGEDGLEVIKEAIAAKSGTAPLVRYEVSLARLVPLIALQPRGEKIAPAAAKVFQDARDGGVIRLTVEGGKALKARLSVTALAVKFFVLTRSSAEPEEEPEN